MDTEQSRNAGIIAKKLFYGLAPDMVLVIPWWTAHSSLRALSENGGDEDFVVVAGPEATIPHALEQLSPASYDEYEINGGYTVAITAHA